MEGIWERAQETGRLLGQTEEYRALRRASDRLSEDRGSVERMNRLGELQDSFARALRSGVEPPTEDQEEYERLVGEVQANPVYQGMVAAQANFDRLMVRVNEEIGRGMEMAGQSRIILPS